jgi:hypothetical protein
MFCGLVLSPSVITSVAVSADAGAEAVNVTLMVHDVPAAILAPQVLDGDAKSVLAAAGTPPLTATLVNTIAAPVLFVSVTVCGAEVTPTGCTPKLRLVGDTTRVGISDNFAT